MVRHCVGILNGTFGEISGLSVPGSYMFDNPFICVTHDQEVPFSNLTTLNNGNDNNAYTTVFSGSGTYQYAHTIYAVDCNPSSFPNTWAKSFSFYSPDLIYFQNSINLESGNDYLFSHGQPDWELSNGFMDMTVIKSIEASPTNAAGSHIRLSGATNDNADDWANRNQISFAQPINDFAGVLGGLPNSMNYCSGFISPTWYQPGNTPAYWNTPHHYVIYCAANIGQPNSFVNNADLGTYYGQYYRNLGSINANPTLFPSNPNVYPSNTKFGAITTGTGIPTAHRLRPKTMHRVRQTTCASRSSLPPCASVGAGDALLAGLYRLAANRLGG